MDIARTSSPSYPVNTSASIVAGSADRSTAPAPVTGSATTAPPAVSPPPKAQGDRVTISQEAKDKLAAEKPASTGVDAGTEAKAGGSTKPEGATEVAATGATMFAYGALGLERPSEETKAAPKDGYTYGRWAGAAITLAAILSVV